MNIIRALCIIMLLLVVGCAAYQKPVPPEAVNAVFPQSDKIMVAACYFKQSSVFSDAKPTSAAEFSDFINSEINAFVHVLGKGMVNEGFDVVATRVPGPCKIGDTDGYITVVVTFVMVPQKFGRAEDLITATTLVKVPSIDYMITLDRQMINGIHSQVSASSAAEKVATLIVDKLRKAQGK